MLYRYDDGSYKVSSPDGQYSRRLTKEEGDRMFRERVKAEEKRKGKTDPPEPPVPTETGFVLA